MAKFTPETLQGSFADTSQVNANFEAIADLINNELLSRNNRDSAEPNQIQTPVDLNSQILYNVPNGTEGSHAINYSQLLAAQGSLDFAGTVAETASATAEQTVFTLTVTTYIPGSNNIAVYVQGVRQHPSAYTETSSSVVTFSEGLALGTQVLFVINERAVGADTVTGSSVTVTSQGVSTNVQQVIANLNVADYTELRALSAREAGISIQVTDEGIAGTFVLRHSPGHGLTDNGGTIIVIDSDWYAERSYTGKVMVTWFGAKDDGSDIAATTTAIQYAFDNFATTDGVHFPSGIYGFSSSLTLTGGGWLVSGDGYENVVLKPTSAVTTAAIDINQGGGDSVRGYIGGFTIACANSGGVNSYATSEAATYYTDYGIRCDSVQDGVMYDRIRVLYTKVAGIYLQDRCWFSTIRDCWFIYNQGLGYWASTNANGVSIIDTRVYLCKSGGKISSVSAAKVIGGGFEDCGLIGLEMAFVSGFDVSGVWFEDLDQDSTGTAGGLEIKGASGDATRPANGSVNGNFFNSCGPYGINAENARIGGVGNDFWGSTVNGIQFDSDSVVGFNEDLNYFRSTITTNFSGLVRDRVDVDDNWTPVISDAITAGNTATFTNVAGSQRYHKRGRMVTISCLLTDIDTTGMTAGNTLYIQGLPIPCASDGIAIGTALFTNTTLNEFSVIPIIDAGTSAIRFWQGRSGNTPSSIIVSDLTSTTSDIYITITYPVTYS